MEYILSDVLPFSTDNRLLPRGCRKSIQDNDRKCMYIPVTGICVCFTVLSQYIAILPSHRYYTYLTL